VLVSLISILFVCVCFVAFGRVSVRVGFRVRDGLRVWGEWVSCSRWASCL